MKNLLVITCLILAGCHSARTIQRDINNQRQQLQDLVLPLDSLDQKRAAKWEKGELDEKADSITRNYISRVKDSISNRLQRFDALSGKSVIRRDKKQVIAYLNNVKTSYKKELDNILFFDDLFDASTFSRLNTAAFFAAGQYMPEENSYAEAKTVMDQLIGDALQFAGRYPSRKLEAMFIVTGYADEESILPESELYRSLAKSISNTSPDRKQLNRELSSRRAVAIKDILQRQYFLLNRDKPSPNLTAKFLAVGKGEALPAGAIRDYKPIDERRRVVLLYWSIMPEL